MIKHKLLVIALLLAAISTQAQGWKFEWNGFVNPHYYADSREVVGSRDDMMLFFPKSKNLDSNGVDLNERWHADMLSITARLGLKIVGPTILGAKTSAYIEGDFTGSTNLTNNSLRLRHAYITLDWADGHQVFAGQYWYPMMVNEITPMTNPLNMGAPFHLYARYNQIRYTYSFGNFEALAAAMWQLDNRSQGILDSVQQSSTTFARHSMVPELNAQLSYRNKRLFLGAAVNMISIQPVVPMAEPAYHRSLTYSVFGSYHLDFMTIKAQAMLHNTMYEGGSMGGYILRQVPEQQVETQDWCFNTYWLDIERCIGHWRPGMFFGYGNNSAMKTTINATTDNVLGRGFDIEYLWRVQPRLTYNTLKGLSFTAEAEYTCAAYAKKVKTGPFYYYTHDSDEVVGNLRLSLSMVYAF